MEFNQEPSKTLNYNNLTIPVFLDESRENINQATVNSFGQEWHRFSSFDDKELLKISSDYFDLLNNCILNKSSIILDVGCGSGRWSKVLADKVKKIEAIDPSSAVFIAAEMLKSHPNVRVSQASVDKIPFENDSFDLVFSLGVLHHVPDTFLAIKNCVEKVKKGGYFLVYLYYALDNRSWLYKTLFYFTNGARKIICKFPSPIKSLICDLIALSIYLPLSKISFIASKIRLLQNFAKNIPLSYYSDKSFYIMRNDSLDRFGTPLEQRFRKQEIEKMLKSAGLTNICFSEKAPYWHAIGQKI